MKKIALTTVISMMFAASSAYAQQVFRISSNGNPTTIEGHVNPLSSKEYQISVGANQQLAIHLTSTSRKKLVKFNLRRNKYTGQPLPGTDGVTDWEGKLKEAGDYWIGVYALPNANEENFTLVITGGSDPATNINTKPDDSSPALRVPITAPNPQNFVPAGWKIAARTKGDLNGDGREDEVLQLVTADTPDDRSETDAAPDKHVLLILVADAGKWRRAGLASDLLVPAAPQYSLELSVAGGVLAVKQSYGMTDVIELKHLFRFDVQSGRFLLIGRDSFFYTRPTSADTVKTSENYVTGVRVTTTGHFRRGAGVVNETSKREPIERKKIFFDDVKEND